MADGEVWLEILRMDDPYPLVETEAELCHFCDHRQSVHVDGWGRCEACESPHFFVGRRTEGELLDELIAWAKRQKGAPDHLLSMYRQLRGASRD